MKASLASLKYAYHIPLYVDPNNVSHGYVRALDGRFTMFDAPGACTGAFQGPSLRTSTRLGRSRETTGTRAVCLTASCALVTAPSPRSWPLGPPCPLKSIATILSCQVEKP
jgi:hypothetical protein